MTADATAWMDEAACLGMGTELFYPTQGDIATGLAAIAVCRTCQVSDTCLEYALTNGEKFGVWGGVGEQTRRRIRSARIRTARLRAVS